MTRILITGMALMLANAAFASNWKHVDTHKLDREHTYQLFIDTASVNRIGPHTVQFWLRYDYNHPQQLPERIFDGYPYYSAKFEQVYDCLQRAGAIATAVYYDAHGQMLTSTQWPKLAYMPVVPDTLDEILINRVCRKKKSR